MKTRQVLTLLAAALFVVGACTPAASRPPSPAATTPSPAASGEPSAPASGEASASPDASGSAPTTGGEPADVRLQLQWAPQAQFAGYFAAEEQGYFEEEDLTVEIIDGGPTVTPQQVGSAPDGPEFTISWVPKVLEAREQESDLVNIAQIFQRSGTLSVSWKDSGITDPCQFAGKKIGVWDFGNEYEVTAAATINCGLTAGTDYEKVIQPFDMSLLLARQIDVAEAMIYNEYAQVLEAPNPETGELYKPEDLNIINYNDQRTAMLQDAIFARKSWLDEGDNRNIAVRFVRASVKGWIYCRDNPDDCVEYTTAAGSQLGQGHQRWMMNEINPLIWPSPLGIGVVDPVQWIQTVRISRQAGIIKADPSFDAYDPTIAVEALVGLTDMDLMGADFTKGTVEVTPGGN
jgi:NitT/TauT family transport system substrate-binding protein